MGDEDYRPECLREVVHTGRHSRTARASRYPRNRGEDGVATGMRQKVKRRIVHTLQKYLFNPTIKLLFALGLAVPGYALLICALICAFRDHRSQNWKAASHAGGQRTSRRAVLVNRGTWEESRVYPQHRAKPTGAHKIAREFHLLI